MSLAETVLHFLFPRTCGHCREDLGPGRTGPLCEPCSALLEWIAPLYCDRCGLPVESGAHCRRCAGRTFQCEKIRAALLLGPPIRSLVVQFKYGGRRRLAGTLGAWTAGALLASPDLAPDALVPVPLHSSRLKSRGYNQSLLLAGEVGRACGVPVLDCLERIRRTPPQVELSFSERTQNLRGAFRATGEAKGLRLLVVDDVGTTGSTLEECAAALKAVDAAWVGGLVLARQPY